MAEAKTKKEKNLVKNYFILAIIFLAGIGLTFYLCRWYKVYDDYKKQTPVIRGTLSQEIVYDDLEHYVLENPTSVIYMCVSNDDVCRNFEKRFAKYIVKEELTDTIVYLNLTNIEKDEFINKFNEKYQFKTNLTGNYPAFVIFKDGKVDSVLQGSSDSEVTLSKVKNFLELNEIKGEGE